MQQIPLSILNYFIPLKFWQMINRDSFNLRMQCETSASFKPEIKAQFSFVEVQFLVHCTKKDCAKCDLITP